MAIRYEWHSEGKDACFACSRWDRKIFTRVEDVPELPVHPNCKCFIRVFNTDDNNLSSLVDNLNLVKGQVGQSVDNLKEKLNNPVLSDQLRKQGEAILTDAQQIYKTIGIFFDNYFKLREANTIGADKYFHAKANAEAAQLGEVAANLSDFISRGREIIDFWHNLLGRKVDWDAVVKDMNEDLKANAYGRQIGRYNPSENIQPLLDKLRPKGLDKKY